MAIRRKSSRSRMRLERRSLPQLKPLEAMQLLFDCGFNCLRASRLPPPPTQLHFCISNLRFLRSVFRSIAATMSPPDQHRQREIAEFALLLRHVGLEAMVVAEEQFGPLALDDQRIERREDMHQIGRRRRPASPASPGAPNAPACRRLRARPAPVRRGEPAPRSAAGSPSCAAHRDGRSNPGSPRPARAARGRADRR